MGEFNIRRVRNDEDRNHMYQHAIRDIEAFEYMLSDNLIDKSTIKIGAEQELCLVNNELNPHCVALDILDQIDDEHFTNELALYNMEINLDPLVLRGNCFSKMESSLNLLLRKNQKLLQKYNTHQVLTGILPTLRYEDLTFKNITPIKRYQTLSDELAKIRGDSFQIHVQGIDEIIMSLNSVLFEACNTSFQLHLQIKPSEFVHKYNWAQLISGPVLAACTNSPLLFGNQLWDETRIAIFKQSLDTRSSYKYLRKKLPRVYFGNSWLENSPSELWKNDLMRFPILLTSDDISDSVDQFKAGKIPELKSIQLHNGTTYTWNRMCYGYSQSNPHLRIECRYLPSGPSAIDEIANMALWIGLMQCSPEKKFWQSMDFNLAKDNFIKSARTGLQSVLFWNNKFVPAKELILDTLIPLAYQGLESSGVKTSDANKYLSIIQQRIETERNGAQWMRSNFRKLSKKMGSPPASRALVKQMVEYQDSNIPIHDWQWESTIQKPSSKSDKVYDIMSTDIISINQNCNILHAATVMSWKNIHHLPIENKNGDLIGIITDGIIARNRSREDFQHLAIQDLMIRQPVTVTTSDPIHEIKILMENKGLSGIPVVLHNKLVGIVTQNDLIPN